ncbi:MAG: hydroxyacylglutathione hydrolase [Candidatus Methylophosphatis roskildensis]
MKITGIPAFQDNYIWCLERDGRALVVDPGDADPVLDHLAASGTALAAILITHHHNDHAGGIAGLVRRFDVPVFGPALEDIAGVTVKVREGDTVRVPQLDAQFSVIKLPGHTLGHVAYYRPNQLFCGDTLFACGCGRLFEGTPAQMLASLSKLAALPGDTQVYCAHEYTQSNIRFALAVEPGNQRLIARSKQVNALRQAGLPSVPSTIETERETNPFLRAGESAVIASARARGADDSPVAVFAALREWKNRY